MKQIIRTRDREIYNKFLSLKFFPEIILTKDKCRNVTQIVKNINKHVKNLDVKRQGDYIIVRKRNNFNFDIYLKS